MKTTKIFLVIVFTPLLISCELLGIEVTTVKGNWKSGTFDDGSFYKMQFDDDKFVFYTMVTDSTYSERIDGTYNMHGDTITLYSEKRGVTDFIVQILSMNTMTIQYGKKILIMSRIYKDPNDKFLEVLELKKNGFWYFILKVLEFVLCIFYISVIYMLITKAVKWLVKMIKKL